MKIKNIKIVPVTFPLRDRFRTSLGQKDVTRNLQVVVELSNGISGYGEASSSLAMPEATPESMSLALHSTVGSLLGQPIDQWQKTCESLRNRFSSHPTALSALECALLDAYCRKNNLGLFQFFGKQKRKIETYFTIPALTLEECKIILNRMIKNGFKKFKIKVTGKSLTEDFKRVSMIAERTENGSMIVDANQGWGKEDCLRFIDKMTVKQIPVALIEQPLPKEKLKELHFIKARSPIPIAVDESFRTVEDVMKNLREDSADVFNIKVAKSGLTESLRIAEVLKKNKKRLMIGCMMESGVGLAASVHWACGTGDFEFVDLDSFLLLKKTPMELPFSSDGPFLSV